MLDGYCRLGPVEAVVSPVMLDTLEYVLEVDCGFAPDLVAAARVVAEGSAAWLAVVGGLVQPMRDREDGGVLDVAIAGGAHLLVTANMADFTPGPRAGIDAEVVRWRGGRADVVVFRHARLPEGLVIATPPAAKAWLVDGVAPPAGVLGEFAR